MLIFYSDGFSLPLPEGHRFPLQKYRLLRQRVQESRLVPAENLCVPDPASEAELSRAHTLDYIQRVLGGSLNEKEVRRIGFPWSPGLVQRSRHSVGGTIAACRSALREGTSVNLAGGTHHAYAGHGEGYCVFNDVAVAARTVQAEGLVERVVILDCDVHQGNGTAAIFAADPTIFTFSIHGEKNFPFHKEPSDLDIALPDGTGDAAFLEAVERGVRESVARARAGLAIYLAGADPYSGDSLGRLSVSKAGLAQRDRLVFEHCRTVGLPVAVVMSGGYAKRIEDTVEIHFQTVRLAASYAVSIQAAKDHQ